MSKCALVRRPEQTQKGNMTSGLAWIIRACLFQVCLWRACLCEEPDCMYNEYLTEMVESLPKDYLFKVNKSEETVERVEKALSRFYGENCKKDFKCEDYNNYNSAVCYLLGCLDGKEPKCVSNVTYSLGEVELISLKGFTCLVKDAFNHNSLQDKACDAVFVDAMRCQKATTLDSQEKRLQNTKTTTIYTTKLHTINYKTSSIPPKTSTSTVTTTTQPPSSSLTSSTISNSDSQEKRLQNTKTTTIYTTKLHTINYKTSSIPPKRQHQQ
ncbi:uncharacterized protein LOC121551682 [Coregonus clupeaformis]|uniref:uncharacterized protein LOC121551682 n=1 Tax=Coregonus clupeaformis TaxID=59861 RepID=UPI001E1C3ACF|nr:uncharacterized protein LOC121551682 [Coregonus clupeaformis]